MCLNGLAGSPAHKAYMAQQQAKYQNFNNDPIPKQIDSIYEDRLRQFIDEGQYKDLNLPKFYDNDRIDHTRDEDNLDKGFIEFKVHPIEGKQNRPLFKDVINDETKWSNAKKGDVFGPSWSTFWFKFNIQIPQNWIDHEQIIFSWDAGNEGLLYTTKGHPLQAFTGGDRNDFILPKEWTDGKEHVFYVEMACNGMFGVGAGSDIAPPDENRYFTLNTADLVVPNLEARALKIDFNEISDAARELAGDGWQKYRAKQVALEIQNSFDPNDVKSVTKGRKIAQKFLGPNPDSEKVFHDHAPGSENKIDVYAIGNCHIDTAWLWPFGETRRKVVRSWTTQLDLLNRYPEYQFVASQAQQFHWLNQDHPDVFQRIQKSSSQNQFIPIGGSWVEHDTNIPGGESLIRQFVKGQRFFQQHFGFRHKTFWLPDTFGYSSQIPQICQLSGLTRFLTQKLSWNNINNFPNTTFNWAALDGTQVLTHMPPAETYTADANLGDVKRSIANHKNLTLEQSSLLLFGKGDGGGGPQPEMIDKLRRCRGISNTVGGLPTVHLGHSVDDFFDHVLETTNQGSILPTWEGELYFEFHRGTYTSQAFVKKFMRRSEIRLHDLEFFASLASILKPKNYKYPQEDIQNIWSDVLLCQFHDVLPGSCIEIVYKDDVRPMLKNAVKKVEDLTKKALSVLFGDIEENNNAIVQSNGKFELLNTLQWIREGVVKLPKSLSNSSLLESNEIEIQKGFKNDYVYVSKGDNSDAIVPLAPGGIKHPAQVSETKNGEFILTNDKLKVVIKGGVLKSLIDLVEDREILDLSSGRNKLGGNQFVLFDDTPLNWQAWDTEVFNVDTFRYIEPGKVSINESGPLRASVIVEQKISDVSTIKTIISIDGLQSLDQASTIDFDSKVDWNESRKFLKVEFPVDIHSDFASYETQFGITRRPTHYNTSWDVAKFEVCHHKFADYSDYSYGVSILNDSKFGFATHGNLLRLSLLRAPKQPDANADIGEHHFKYSLFPHKGPLSSKTVELAHNFNYDVQTPYFIKPNGGDLNTSAILNFIRIKGDHNLVLSNVKRAEDDEDISTGELPIKQTVDGGKSIIVRVYESLGGQGRGILTSNQKIVSVSKVNALEDELETLEFNKIQNDHFEVPIKLRAFEIASYKLVFA
ncbi:putative mannosidase [Wickerhamomyces ciferrii]|uniref:Alpha-mannosidase n=1 Tax=Wickerhamomyces ciferrii (strain ATCC 14091 / BCRC 22168 / CBS 111 / JCM 3599 / NBRC 0793 / NRRL Y-1031 F-60-10) TaxID=1206466 RepID=K0KGJ0_WICCF|nr:putative mannosidase [Wickerhamomyces ciferrii]CCH42096.1 putative mannosidase [Wickerhamomyces ciferrii]